VPKGQDASATEPDARATESQTPPSKARCHHPSGEMPPPKTPDASTKEARCRRPSNQKPAQEPTSGRYKIDSRVFWPLRGRRENDKSANITPTIFFFLNTNNTKLHASAYERRRTRATISGHPNPMAYSATCLPQNSNPLPSPSIFKPPFTTADYY